MSELPAAAEAVSAALGELAEAMRADGARIGVGELLCAHRALTAIDPGRREDVRIALGAVLCSCRADLARFSDAFARVFSEPGAQSAADPPRAPATRPPQARPRGGRPDPGQAAAAATDREPVAAAWSAADQLLGKDFAEYSESEYAAARQLIAQLARRTPMRRSRRQHRDDRRGRTVDLRRTVRASLACAGEPIELRRRGPGQRPRSVVLICDVSGSMTPYARMLLQYMHACVAARRRVEAFAFATRLTRITRELAGRDPDRAFERATAAVVDLSGGTRMGEAIARLNREYGRTLGRGACVVVLSDGWDRGDPEQLSAEMARLRRSAHRLVWLNPLAADPRYEPLTRGMAAAFPHTDRMLAGNSLASLQQLAQTLEQF